MPERSDTPHTTGAADGAASLVEQLVSRILQPLGLVVLSRERIQQTLDEAAERGRITRSDANELVVELVRRGRQQTEEVLAEIDRLLGVGRRQLGSATRVARRTVRGGAFPITGYGDLTASEVQKRLPGLSAAELRQVRDHEQRHANRKSVLSAIDRALR